MKRLHIDQPDTQMARDVLEFAQYAADMLDKTQFIVMERRTWERLMPRAPEARADGQANEPSHDDCEQGRT